MGTTGMCRSRHAANPIVIVHTVITAREHGNRRAAEVGEGPQSGQPARGNPDVIVYAVITAREHGNRRGERRAAEWATRVSGSAGCQSAWEMV
jgi:hypothetical protein